MTKSSATAVKSSGPMQVSHGMLVFEGPYARAYATHWTIGRALKAIFFVFLMLVAFLAYAEYRFHFSPSAFWNVSPTAFILREMQAPSR